MIIFSSRRAANTIGGDAESTGLKTTGGSILNDIAKSADDQSYQPPEFHWNQPSTYKNLPEVLAGGLPSMGQDLTASTAGATIGGAIAGPPGALIGGVGGWGLSHYAHSSEADAKAHAKAAGRDTPEDSDYLAAKANAAAQGIIGRLGVELPLNTAIRAGTSPAQAVANTALRGASGGVAAGAASPVASGLTLKGELPSGNEVADSAVEGGVAGTVLGAARAGQKLNNLRSVSDIDIPAGKDVMSRLSDIADIRTKSGLQEALPKAHTDLKVEIGDLAGHVQRAISGTVDSDNPTAKDNADNTILALKKAKARVDEGIKPDPEDMTTLEKGVGHIDEGQKLIKSLKEQTALQQISAAVNYNKSTGKISLGLGDSQFNNDYLNPLGGHGKYLGVAPLIGAAFGIHFPGPLGYLAGHALSGAGDMAAPFTALGLQLGANATLRGLDYVSGAREKPNTFADYFSGDKAPAVEPSGLPSVNELIAAKTAQQQAEKQQAAADSAEGKSAQKEVDDKLKANARLIRLMSNSEKLQNTQEQGAQREDIANAQSLLRTNQGVQKLQQASQDNQLVAAKKRLEMMAKSEGISSTSAALPIRVAKLREALDKAAEKAANKAEAAPKSHKADHKPDKEASKGETHKTPEGTEYTASEDRIVVHHRGETVNRPAEGVRNRRAYADATALRMEVRHNAIDKAKATATSPEAHKALDTLHKLWNHSSPDYNSAYSHLEATINSKHIPDGVRKKVFEILDAPEVTATWN